MRAIRRRVGREFCPYATKSRDECWNQPAVTHKNLVTAHSTAATDFAREILAVLRRSPMSCGALVWSDAAGVMHWAGRGGAMKTDNLKATSLSLLAWWHCRIRA
jgi:hypothetical protein